MSGSISQALTSGTDFGLWTYVDGYQCEAKEDYRQIRPTQFWMLKGQSESSIEIVCRADVVFVKFNPEGENRWRIFNNYGQFEWSSGQYSGWRLQWSQLQVSQILATSGVMTLPNWPKIYPRDHESTQAIQVEKGHYIKLLHPL